MEQVENETIEIDLLLEAIYRKYGHDFRGYAKPTVKRRINRRLQSSGLSSISAMQHKVLTDREFLNQLLLDLSINVTEMFRDPPFFKALRQCVLPELASRQMIKIWHAGCATGEEVYSMAIMLAEAGLTNKTRIYATDFNDVVLDKAKQGIFPAERIPLYTSNYQQAGGVGSFADYYTAKYDSAIVSSSLKKNIIFTNHNLVTDSSFGEMDLVICRNVLIYFSKPLQSQVLRLLSDSLCEGGFLCLGNRETISRVGCGDEYEIVDSKQRIHRKKVNAFELKPVAQEPRCVTNSFIN